jgi:hypothetical protein
MDAMIQYAIDRGYSVTKTPDGMVTLIPPLSMETLTNEEKEDTPPIIEVDDQGSDGVDIMMQPLNTDAIWQTLRDNAGLRIKYGQGEGARVAVNLLHLVEEMVDLAHEKGECATNFTGLLKGMVVELDL